MRKGRGVMEKACINCKFSFRYNDVGRFCYAIIGECKNYDKFEPIGKEEEIMNKICQTCEYANMKCFLIVGTCRNHDKWKPQNKKRKYKIVKPFTLLDIVKKSPCISEFIKLVNELHPDVKASSHTFSQIRYRKTLKNDSVLVKNFNWMETHFPGAIVKIEEETIVQPGMIAYFSTGESFIISSNLDWVNRETGETLKRSRRTVEATANNYQCKITISEKS